MKDGNENETGSGKNSSSDHQQPDPQDPGSETKPTQEEPEGGLLGFSMKQVYVSAAGLVVVGLGVIVLFGMLQSPPQEGPDPFDVVQAESQTTNDAESTYSSSFDRYTLREDNDPVASSDVMIQPARTGSYEVASPEPADVPSQGSAGTSSSDRNPSKSQPRIKEDGIDTDFSGKVQVLEDSLNDLKEELGSLKDLLERKQTRLSGKIRSLEQNLQKQGRTLETNLSSLQKDRKQWSNNLAERLNRMESQLRALRSRQITEDRHMKNWTLLAIAPDRALIQGPRQQTHQVKVGQQVGDIKILAIMATEGLVRTSQGTILRK